MLAQTSYEKLWDCQGAAPLAMTELANGNVLVNFQYSRGASVFDTQGNLVQSTHYWNSQVGGPFAIRRRSANEFVFVTTYERLDSCSSFMSQTIPPLYPAAGTMDSLGNVETLRCYSMNAANCRNFPRDLEVTADGGVVVWGRDKFFFALRTNANGEPLWSRHFGYDGVDQAFGHHGSFQFIHELPGGDLLAGINMDTAGVVVARMDADGNFLWCKSYIRPSGMVHDCLIESDDSFIITGATDTIASTNSLIPLPPDYHPQLFMMKLDGGGEVQWCKGYDSTPNIWYSRRASRIVRAHDGNYMVLSNLGVQGYNLEYRPLLLKTDLNGDTLWTRSVGRNGYRHSIGDLLPYSDGGYIYNGVIIGDVGPSSGAYYIFKTDSLGHLPCYERWHPITITDLFPVDSSFTLTSTDGAMMYEVTVTDTTYAPIVVYDGCTFTTGMPPSIVKGRTMSIRPNPNTGRFTIAFQDPLMAETYYSVYDALGKLLYQRPLAPGKTTEEVDLSRFGAGTYVIRCTDPGGVSYERVVVE
ncbi:MAG: T9SS type A sorting domain-containing protein [Flavobacteriales bacterium]|nr:T9SS type A sorting domain-containing protein [Flavobacteriales bacterium]